MKCINFDELYRDFLSPEEENHIKSCVVCRVQWQYYTARFAQTADDIIEDMKAADRQQSPGGDAIIAVLKKILPASSALKEHLLQIAQKAARVMPGAPPERIAAVLAHFDPEEINSLSDDVLRARLKTALDTPREEDNG